MINIDAYYLASCSTCIRILKYLDLNEANSRLHDIKSQPMTELEVDKMAKMAGSYEALFSRRALKFRELNLHLQTLTEPDYRNLILKEYTFLKRPVFIVGNEIFVGNSSKVIEQVKQALRS
jgi:arsenate reductase